MNAYVNISNELRNFFSTNKIFKRLVPLDSVIMFTGLALMLLNCFPNVNIGSLFSSLAYWAFIAGSLLTYASMKEKPLYIGLLGYGAIHLIELLSGIFGRFHIFYWSDLFGLAIYGGLGYLLLKKTLVDSTTVGKN